MSFSVTVIGSNSAVPAHGRHPSAQVVTINDKLYLIDCGEGSQMLLTEFGIKWMRFNQIFITHLHGDHIFGLIGVISSYHLMRRNRPLEIYSPAGLEQVIRMQLEAGHTELCYPLHFHVVDHTQAGVIFENEDILVETAILLHRVPCVGYIFREKKRQPKIIREKLAEYAIPVELIPEIKSGKDILDEQTGERIPNSELTIPPPRARSFAYICDTAYAPEIVPLLKNIDLLYHDSTFGEESAQRAEDTFHSTAKQAARIAKAANAGMLMIGHFSSKYDDLQPLLREAMEEFPNSVLAQEGKTFEILR